MKDHWWSLIVHDGGYHFFCEDLVAFMYKYVQLDLITKNRYPVGNNLICTILCADMIRFISILESWTLCRGTCAVCEKFWMWRTSEHFADEDLKSPPCTMWQRIHSFFLDVWTWDIQRSHCGIQGHVASNISREFSRDLWDLWIFWISLLDRLFRCEVAWNCKFWGFENWWWAQYLVSNLHELSRVYQILNRYEAWTRSAAKPLHWVVAGLFSCLVLELSTYNAMLRSYHHFHVIRFGGCHLQRSDYNKYWVDEDHSGAPKIAKLVYD
jgi:hypothetical protein